MMTFEIKIEVEKFIKNHNLDAEIREIVEDAAYVLVDSKDYERAISIDTYEIFQSNIHIQWEQKKPLSVQAEVGDVVLIFNPYSVSETDCKIGLVTSKIPIGDEFSYGCRYIMLIDSIYDFELTREDYGGYHNGFLKVLNDEEIQEKMKLMIQKKHEKDIAEANDKKNKFEQVMPDFIKSLKENTVKVTQDSLYFNSVPFAVKITEDFNWERKRNTH